MIINTIYDLYLQSISHRRRSRGQRGQLPPLAEKGGGKRYKMPPPFRRFSGMMPASTENIGICEWKCVKYYKKCVKFACNYFWNSSAPVPRPPVVLRPSQTFFRSLCSTYNYMQLIRNGPGKHLSNSIDEEPELNPTFTALEPNTNLIFLKYSEPGKNRTEPLSSKNPSEPNTKFWVFPISKWSMDTAWASPAVCLSAWLLRK